MTGKNIQMNCKKQNTEYSHLTGLDKFSSLFKKKIWRVKDVARYTGWSIGHIYNLVSDEKIPSFKKGRSVFFIPETIHSWLLEGDLV